MGMGIKTTIMSDKKLDARSLWLFWDFNTYIQWPEQLENLHDLDIMIDEEYEWRKEWAQVCGKNHGMQAEFLECMAIMDWLGGQWMNNELHEEFDPYEPTNYPLHLQDLVLHYPKFVKYICLRYFG
jgi:hypothetical protein